MKVKNISDQPQAVPMLPSFAPGEERKVSNSEAEMLSRNPNFEIVKVKGTEKSKSVKAIEAE